MFWLYAPPNRGTPCVRQRANRLRSSGPSARASGEIERAPPSCTEFGRCVARQREPFYRPKGPVPTTPPGGHRHPRLTGLPRSLQPLPRRSGTRLYPSFPTNELPLIKLCHSGSGVSAQCPQLAGNLQQEYRGHRRSGRSPAKESRWRYPDARFPVTILTIRFRPSPTKHWSLSDRTKARMWTRSKYAVVPTVRNVGMRLRRAAVIQAEKPARPEAVCPEVLKLSP